MSFSYWKKHHSLPPTSDITIIGGGFIGLSVAYWLKLKKPQLDICILDSQELGEGASGRNAGFLTKGSLSFYKHLTHTWGLKSAEDIFHFAQESIRLVLEHFHLEECLRTSSVSLYTNQNEFEFIGFESIRPPFTGIKSSFKSEGEASINPVILLKTLERILKEKGVRIFRGVECFKLSQNTLETNFGEMSSGEIVVALNGFTNSILTGLVKPQRAQMLCVELKKPLPMNALFYEPDSRVYFKSVGENRIIIGGKRLTDPLAEETSVLAVNPKIQQSLENYVYERLGEIQNIHARWSGIMGFTADELPFIEKRDHYYLITGFSGHGMGFGFNASRNLSDMILENKSSFFQSIKTTRLQSE